MAGVKQARDGAVGILTLDEPASHDGEEGEVSW